MSCEGTPYVAVCVCTCSRPQGLDRLLTQLRLIDLGGWRDTDIHLIVVDNQPDGQARAIAELHRPHLPISLHFAEEPERGISFARNRAVAEARRLGARFVAFIDDDDEPCRHWLCRLLEKQEETDADQVFGVDQPAGDLIVPDWLADIPLFRPSPFEGKNSYGLPKWAGTYNALIRLDFLDTMGCPNSPFRPGFAVTGGGDTDFFIRAHRAGAVTATTNQSIVYRGWDGERKTLTGVLKRAFRLGATRVYLEKRHRSAEDNRRRRRRRIKTLISRTFLLPTAAFSKRRLAVHLYDVAGSLGEIYAYTGKEYAYYR